MELDDLDEYNLNGYDGKSVAVIAQRDCYLVLRVAPDLECGHRQVDSLVFAAFPSAAIAASAPLGLPRGLDAVLRDAIVAVADPDLGLGDFGVSTWGPEEQLPAVLQQRLEIAREQGFRMAWRGVAPKDLSDETMRWLASTPEPRPVRIPVAAASPQYFRLMRAERDLGVIDCNGMKWANAVTAVLRDGLMGAAMSEDKAELAAADVTIARLPADYEPNGTEVTAQRRARGTAPVSDNTRSRYVGLLQALKAKAEDYPLPALDKDASKLVALMSA